MRLSPGCRKLRKEEEKDAIALPADGLDVAHSLEEVEMEAGLVERYEDRLRAIDDAFNRLERGRYGICEKCKQEIPIERLKPCRWPRIASIARRSGTSGGVQVKGTSTSHRAMFGRLLKNSRNR